MGDVNPPFSYTAETNPVCLKTTLFLTTPAQRGVAKKEYKSPNLVLLNYFKRTPIYILSIIPQFYCYLIFGLLSLGYETGNLHFNRFDAN
jgi:hypothetical protein